MQYILDSFMNIRIADIFDILVVAFILYKFVIYVRETRTMQLLKGIIIILLIWFVSRILNLFMVNFMIEHLMTWGIISIVILFQAELRYALEKLGRGKFIPSSFGEVEEKNSEKMIKELLDAVDYFSDTKTGALIAIERDTGLGEIVRTGVSINAIVSSNLIKNIFFKNAPMHDGAMIIKNNKIAAVSCLLPLSSKYNISKDLGTRHRAGLGLSEQSDAFIIIVSEETGFISVSVENEFARDVNIEELDNLLREKFVTEVKETGILSFLGGKKDEEEN